MNQVVDAVSEATRYRRAWLILPMEQGVGIDVVGYALADRQRVNQRMASLDWHKDRIISLEMCCDETLVIPDMRLCPEADQAQVEYFGNRTVIAVPMLRLGERLGCFNLGTFAAEGVMPPTNEELDFAVEVAALISVVARRIRAEAKILDLNHELEERVNKRTAELAEKNKELERFNKLFVDRELKMIELKQRIKELERNPPREGG
ncbi:MAG: GAF domain-containing protein [Spirochaetaceae bacterium]|nr:GAF domain-containing protein [Spirochaetaceae bacterium]